MPPTWSPRGFEALRVSRKSKFGLKVQLRMLYPQALKFLGSEVPDLRYDLREVMKLPDHLEGSYLDTRFILMGSILIF